MLAVLATFACVLLVDPEVGPLVLSVVLCLSLARSQLDRDLRGRVEALITMPIIGLVATGVGFLLAHLPVVGAALFILGMSGSIWLRRFGPVLRRAGGLLALPFVALLIVPYTPSTRFAGPLALLIPVAVALLAFAWVTAFQYLGRLARVLPPPGPVADTTARASTLRPSPSTRMALQMLVALSVAFLVGELLFASHWAWIVLTAFLVNSGNRGRADVAYKSVLRVLGAGVGTVAAILFTVRIGGPDATTVVLILLAVFLGTWLRPLGYAWWALFVTLALALLEGFTGQATAVLGPRILDIVIGAVIGVASAWFVLPIPSIGVLRRRIAEALATLSGVFDGGAGPEDFARSVEGVEQVAPAFRALRMVSRRRYQPADWVDVLRDCVPLAGNPAPADAKRALGAARRSMREPEEILGALTHLRGTLGA